MKTLVIALLVLAVSMPISALLVSRDATEQSVDFLEPNTMYGFMSYSGPYVLGRDVTRIGNTLVISRSNQDLSSYGVEERGYTGNRLFWTEGSEILAFWEIATTELPSQEEIASANMAAKKQAEEEAKVKAAEAAALEEERQELAKAKAAEAAALAKVKAAEAAAFQQCVSELVNSIIEGSSDPALLSRLESSPTVLIEVKKDGKVVGVAAFDSGGMTSLPTSSMEIWEGYNKDTNVWRSSSWFRIDQIGNESKPHYIYMCKHSGKGNFTLYGTGIGLCSHRIPVSSGRPIARRRDSLLTSRSLELEC